jgi:hypothetical protein
MFCTRYSIHIFLILIICKRLLSYIVSVHASYVIRHFLLTCLRDLFVSFVQPFSGKKAKFLVLELLFYSARLSDFRIIRHHINGILLYVKYSFFKCCYKRQQIYEIFLSQWILNNVPNWLVLFDTTVPVLFLLYCYLKFKQMSHYANINWKYFLIRTWSFI